MSELTGIYAIWEREFRVFLREKSRIISSLINPLFWLVTIGGGLGSRFSIGNVGYQVFIYPGIIVMSVLFSSIFYGSYVVWDKRLDFLKEVLVSPLRRITIFFGKVMGGVTDSLIQVALLLLLAPLFGIGLALNFLLAYALLFVLVIGLVSIGLTIGSLMESPEGFGFIVSFITFPLFFLSGALYPLDNLPSWLTFFTRINPVTYGVDAVRNLILGVSTFSLAFDFTIILGFSTIMVLIGSFAFSRIKL